jgi:hypothetical protein
MAGHKLILGGTAVLGIKLARTLYLRWRALGPAEQQRLEPLAEDAKELALELRGAADRGAAERDLQAANESLAAGILESAEGDPELTDIEVVRLREDLRRELERLASADITARRADGARGEAGAEPPTRGG